MNDKELEQLQELLSKITLLVFKNEKSFLEKFGIDDTGQYGIDYVYFSGSQITVRYEHNFTYVEKVIETAEVLDWVRGLS